ncbi:hypothetical protein P280DRAFT_481368 [Massarina eburnea CBS 473.64]|uniref:BTB domain-containing protein n=1 Tax=Massarina eburnea CBS 473.64 TaxID=1395130 RepID=A0A6A6RUH6_9PLEO|nr:hypothetical protein P280DRAFT_481368 [Massarina eburnea CBS 473.64]
MSATTENISPIMSATTVTLDDSHDLVLHVGTTDHANGAVSFRVNKGVLQMGSEPFNAMLAADLAEATQSEISFPHDSPQYFEPLLKIMHGKVEDLPSNLSMEALVELAKLCDKYGVTKVVAPFVANWLGQQKDPDTAWKLCSKSRDCLFVAHVFDLVEDRATLLSLLIMNTTVDRETKTLIYEGEDGTIVYVDGTSLPKKLLVKIRRIRMKVLNSIRVKCTFAMLTALAMNTCSCENATCKFYYVGLLISIYKDLGLLPILRHPAMMTSSIFNYLDSMERMVAAYPPDFRGPGYCSLDPLPMPWMWSSVTQIFEKNGLLERE